MLTTGPGASRLHVPPTQAPKSWPGCLGKGERGGGKALPSHPVVTVGSTDQVYLS